MTMASDPTYERSEIVFLDLETTIPTRTSQGRAILEFGAIFVCPRKLEELWHYSTFVRPANPSLISSLPVRCNGITPNAIISAPSFSDIADSVYEILNGRIWAGHNILRFDCARIKEAFAEIGRPPPEPKRIIDSLVLLTLKFGRRVGNMKLAGLATYFGLGKQTHRSLDDVRMNLEVLKCCAAVLLLESSLPDAFPENSWISPNATTSSREIGNSPVEGPGININCPSSSPNFENIASEDHGTQGNHPLISLLTSVPFDMGILSNEMDTPSLQQDVAMEENPLTEYTEMPSSVTDPEGCSGYAEFLQLDEVSLSSIRVFFVPFFRGSPRMVLLHKEINLQLCCHNLRVRFGLSTKFSDQAGRPRLNFVVDASPSLCGVLDACDDIAQKSFAESGSNSDWRHVVSRKPGFVSNPTVRIHIPIAVNGDVAEYATEIYQKDISGASQKLVFSKFDAAELEPLFSPGTLVDAYLSLDPYDYQQSAGIRLVAKKLVICIWVPLARRSTTIKAKERKNKVEELLDRKLAN